MTTQFPLTPMQQGMLLHSSVSPNSGIDVLQFVIDFQERVDVDAFVATWCAIVGRHHALRSSFHRDESGEPFQVFHDDAHLEHTEKDLTRESAEAQSDAIQRYLESDRRNAFDLSLPCPMRLALFKLSPANYRCIWTIHHIVTDGHSVGLLLREFSALYDSGSHPSDLPVPRPFPEYLAFMETQSRGEAEAWWSDLLSGIEAATQLGSRQSHLRSEIGAADQSIRIDAADVALLADAAASAGVSRAVLFLAAWGQLLHRYSGGEEVLFGYTRGGRRVALDGAGDIVGPLINTVPFRSSCPEGTSVSRYLEQVAQQVVAVRPHELTPLWKIRGWSRIKGDQPLFESLVVVQPYGIEDFFGLKEPGSPWLNREISRLELLDNPLTLLCYPGPTTIDIKATYLTSHFDEATVRRILEHYRAILLGFCGALNEPVLSVDMMPSREREQVLRQWNDNRADIPSIDGVHVFFEERAALNPGSIAVTDGEQSLDYAETSLRADALAVRIRQAGATRDRPVGILMERCLHLPVAVLSVLKSGSAYCPLDPAYPADRLTYMMDTAGIGTVLATWSLRDHPCLRARAEAPSPQVIWVDRPDESHDAPRPGPVACRPDNLAYVMFTSGSTGKPKAVAMPHAPLINLVSWQLKHSDCGNGSRTLQFAALSFDVSFQEMFATWAAGGTLVLVGDETRRDLVELARYLEEQRINRLFLPFVMLQELAHAASVLSVFPASLREVITAGEQLQITPAIRMFFEELKGCRLVNQYGPTEAHVVAFHQLDDDREKWEALPPIGRPIDNSRLYIMDSRLQPVPVGVPGELFIGGAGLADGYFHEPALTAEKFLTVPAAIDPAGRLYRTGDLCRRRADGVIDYLGRMDQQVKIRGFRVEPGEIEGVIRNHPDVAEVVVDAGGSGRKTGKLVGYVVRNAAAAVATNAEASESLRQALLRELPDHMVPAAFVFLESLPKTPSGKLDRGALPDPASAMADREFVAPSTETELRLGEIWCDVLDLERVSSGDSFFDLGGDSLAAAVLFMRIKMSLGKELPISSLYENRTIEALAKAIDSSSAKPGAAALVAMQPEGTRRPLFLVHGGWGSILHMRHLVESLGKDQPSYGLEAPDAETSPIYHTIEARASAYLTEIIRFQPEGSIQLGGYCIGGVIALEMARQLRERGREVDLVLLIDSFAPGYVLPSEDAEAGGFGKRLRGLLSPKGKGLGAPTARRRKRFGPEETGERDGSAAEDPGGGRYEFFKSTRDAVASHRTAPFRGNVHLFRSGMDTTSRNLGWGKTFFGKEKIYRIPGGHTGSLYPPKVEQWAPQVRELLSDRPPTG